jgi:ADP-ribose pyrophosphatase YjhB (NUDIX family)
MRCRAALSILGETVEAACRRELREETGLVVGRLKLVGIYSDPARDPRSHTCSVAFTARARTTRIAAGDDAASRRMARRLAQGEPSPSITRSIVADARQDCGDAPRAA